MRTILTLAALIAIAGPVYAQTIFGPGSEAMGEWRNTIPNATNEIPFADGGYACDGAYLYIFGGNTTGAMRRFSPETATWSVLPSMPTPVVHNVGIFSGGAIYSFGGTGTGAVFRYDLNGATWTQVATLPGPREGMAVAEIGGAVHVIGGIEGATYLTDNLQFDGATFTPKAPLPQPRAYGVAAGYEPMSYLLFAMGTNGINHFGTTWRYFPATDTWEDAAPCNGLARRNGSLFVLGGRIYLCGGLTPTGSRSPLTFQYHPVLDSWHMDQGMQQVRSGHATGVIGAFAYAFGGTGTGLKMEWFRQGDHGLPPNDPQNVMQESTDGPVPPGGYTRSDIKFYAHVSDPDEDDRLRLEVQVRPMGATTWAGAARVYSGYRPAGVLTADFHPDESAQYDWRFVVYDRAGNLPSGWTDWKDFTLASPDFNSDRIPPGQPTPVFPVDITVGAPVKAGGDVTFTWTCPADNFPGLTFEVQIAHDKEMSAIFESYTDIAGESLTTFIARTGKPMFWRVRPTDAARNVGTWSAIAEFGLGFDDPKNNGAGDAARVCGFSANAGSAGLFILLAALLLSGVRAAPRGISR